MKPDSSRSWLGTWAFLLALVASWEVAVRYSSVSSLILPAPSAVIKSLWKGLSTGYLWPHIRTTGLELILGLSIGCLIGFVGGVVMAESAVLHRVLKPYVVISQVVPKLALAPLFIVWFGFGMTSTVVMTALICFFPLMENTMTSLQQVDRQRLELFRMLGATRYQTLVRLKLPTGLPGILAGLRVAVVLALVGAVVGEFIGASQGLGALIIVSQGMMDTPLMFAVLVVIATIGLVLYHLTLAVETYLLQPYTRTS